MVWVHSPAHRLDFASEWFLWLLLSLEEICGAPQGRKRPELQISYDSPGSGEA